MTVTEARIFSFKSGLDITDHTSDAHKSLASALDVIKRQPGYQELWVGPSDEVVEQVHLFVNWDKLDSHQAFIDNQSEYAQLGQKLKPVLNSKPSFIHVNFEPSSELKKAFGGPVTEEARLYFPLDTDKAKVIEGHKAFCDAAAKDADGWGGSVAGWADAEVENDKVSGKALMFIVAIAWPSVEKHMEFRASKAFESIVALLTRGADCKDLVMAHIKLAQKL